MKPTLSDLPGDVLVIVIKHLDAARDLRALALMNRRLSRLISNEGWRIFVRNRFNSLSIPVPSTSGGLSWRQLADSLTWQSRCWDRRALQFQSLRPDAPSQRSNSRRSGSFQPIVQAHFDLDTQEEMVLWGAGEEIVARYRQRARPDDPGWVKWARSGGAEMGYVAGRDDVTAMSILKDGTAYNGDRAFLTGRDNGELTLLSAELDRFGQTLVRFDTGSSGDPELGTALNPWPERNGIGSVDIVPVNSESLIAAATKSAVLVYKVPSDDATDVSPLARYGLTDLPAARDINFDQATLCHATWMGQGDTLALALKGSSQPLQYISITPSGWSLHAASKNARLESSYGIEYGNICPHSLQPVKPESSSKGGTSLLLSAWRDGTCRLQDLRTPSAFDMVYQDDVDPTAMMEVLMTYGTERFVGGGMDGGSIRIFDFRWNKGYYHTLGLPCADKVPHPTPGQPLLKDPANFSSDRAFTGSRCDHVLGKACRWHGLSRHAYNRPNARFLLARAIQKTQILHDEIAIWSLSRASDVSPNFYIGTSGGIVEANLEPFGNERVGDPNFGFDGWRDSTAVGVGYSSKALDPRFMETGDGRLGGREDRSYTLPPLWAVKTEFGSEGRNYQQDPHQRLDDQFNVITGQWRTSNSGTGAGR
ncbi:EID1-like F-box protein 1 [Echria macrotheca]|uniref:EID1-like F-box protein 1 n=1 Tax=Echria macrotheca TaxID=438768 RepID=A0AAJ0BKN2_9PEZI|nr:EID1-like F-box protein 1 [Echria macrotheca]